MKFEQVFGALNVSSSGLNAERMRMEVTANNIANAFTTRTADGGPFRRQDVVFSAVLDNQGGVEASEVQDFPWGRFVFFADPDGNRWAVQQLT